MNSDPIQTTPGQTPTQPPVEVSAAELAATATLGGRSVVPASHETLLTTPSGLLKTGVTPADVQKGKDGSAMRLALVIAVALLAAGALFSFLTLSH